MALQETTPQTETQALVNGLDTTLLNDLRDTLNQQPEAGRVRHFARTRWQDGTRVYTTIGGFQLDGVMLHQDKRLFVARGDEPGEMSGTDSAPGPVEWLLHALGSCVTVSTAVTAALMGVRLSRLELELESDLDLHGLFGAPNVRPGVQELRVRMNIAGDANEETLREIGTRGFRYSPVRDSVENGVTVIPEIFVAA